MNTMMKYVYSFLILSFFVSCAEDPPQKQKDTQQKQKDTQQEQGNTQSDSIPTLVEKFLNKCNDLSPEFEQCVSQINAQSSVSLVALSLEIKTCSSYVPDIQPIRDKYDVCPMELAAQVNLNRIQDLMSSDCVNKPSNQEIKDCSINALKANRKSICKELADSRRTRECFE